jgi:hypothetical protein
MTKKVDKKVVERIVKAVTLHMQGSTSFEDIDEMDDDVFYQYYKAIAEGVRTKCDSWIKEADENLKILKRMKK